MCFKCCLAVALKIDIDFNSWRSVNSSLNSAFKFCSPLICACCAELFCCGLFAFTKCRRRKLLLKKKPWHVQVIYLCLHSAPPPLLLKNTFAVKLLQFVKKEKTLPVITFLTRRCFLYFLYFLYLSTLYPFKISVFSWRFASILAWLRLTHPGESLQYNEYHHVGVCVSEPPAVRGTVMFLCQFQHILISAWGSITLDLAFRAVPSRFFSNTPACLSSRC